MTAFIRFFPTRVWIALGVVLAVVLLFVGYRMQEARANRAEAALAPAKATVTALDKVNTETVAIQADTTEKQRAVDEIEGSDTRLPDGYGARIECVRRGGGDCNSR